jgi:membrane protein implicated in regulation of membrane protease activity
MIVLLLMLILMVMLFGPVVVLFGGAAFVGSGTYMLMHIPTDMWVMLIGVALTPVVLVWLGRGARRFSIIQARNARQTEREAFWGPRHPSWDVIEQNAITGRVKGVRREPRFSRSH